MVYVDLAELPVLFEKHPWWSFERPNIVSFRRSDYMGPKDTSLDTAVRDLVFRRTGHRPQGPIRLLTHLRTWGYCFNPVSIYYCFDKSGEDVGTIVTDINNTPWGERHAYVLSPHANIHTVAKWRRYRFNKTFHISPFMDMELAYDWRFKVPGEHTAAHMRILKDGRHIFDASLQLRRLALNRTNLTRVLFQYPLLTHKVTLMIYWQALRLWRKRLPFYTHPAKRSSA